MNNSQKMLDALEKQDLNAVDTYFQQALEEDSSETLFELATYLEGIGFFDQAKIIYQELAPSYPESYLSLAMIAGEDGEIEEAFAYLDEISPTSDLYVAALLTKADLYQMEGLADVAREKLEEASYLSDDPLIQFALAEIDFELGNFSQAILAYANLDNREISQQTGISTYQRIGIAYASQGRFEVAIEFLEKALELEYDDRTVYELAVLLYDQEEYQKANIYFKQLATMSPEFEGYEYPYALSLHAEHQLEQALEVTKQGLEKNPFDTQLLLFASQLSYELHDSEGAEQYLLLAKEDAEDVEEIALRLTNLYLGTERFEDVLAFDQQDLDHVLTKWNIARAHYQLEDEEALEAYQNLYPDLQDNPEFLEQYAYLLREYGELNQAKVVAKRYLDLVADDVAMQEFYDSL